MSLMTVKELSEYLKVNPKTVYRMIDNKEIPGVKVRGQWRFIRSIIDEWLDLKVRELSSDQLTSIEKRFTMENYAIWKTLSEENIFLDIKAKNGEELINEMVDRTRFDNFYLDKEYLKELILDRESICSTALSEGIAIPHPRRTWTVGIENSIISIGYSEKGIDFNSLDGKLTYLFFMLLTSHEREHLVLLSRLSRLLKDKEFVNKIIGMNKNKKEIITAFKEKEKELFLSLT